jgi:hypothetical protein
MSEYDVKIKIAEIIIRHERLSDLLSYIIKDALFPELSTGDDKDVSHNILCREKDYMFRTFFLDKLSYDKKVEIACSINAEWTKYKMTLKNLGQQRNKLAHDNCFNIEDYSKNINDPYYYHKKVISSYNKTFDRHEDFRKLIVKYDDKFDRYLALKCQRSLNVG